MVNALGSNGKIAVEPFRSEIEERTRNGESCEQIADALRSIHGLEISHKTVSRKRLEWGLRKRASRRPNPDLEARRAAVRSMDPRRALTKKGMAQNKTKEDITARTHRGESAEQIAAELMAQGVKLNRGPSTILRLQTFWGLIPPDPARARGKTGKLTPERKQAYDEQNNIRKAAKTVKRQDKARSNVRSEAAIHYPKNCQARPNQSRALAPAPPPATVLSNPGGFEHIPISIQSDLEDCDDSSSSSSSSSSTPLPASEVECMTNFCMATAASSKVHQDVQKHKQPQVTHSEQPREQPRLIREHMPQTLLPQFDHEREIMCAELMVDLAISMLGAARHVKDTLLTAQQRRPLTNYPDKLPPSSDEILQAKRKLKEATRCAWNFAKDIILDDV